MAPRGHCSKCLGLSFQYGFSTGVVCPQGHWMASEALVIIWGVGPGMLCSHSAQDAPNVSGGLYQQIMRHFTYVSFKN